MSTTGTIGAQAGAIAFSAAGTFALLLASGCGHTDVISVDGSSTVYLISAVAAEKFHDVDPNVNVVVGKSGTGGGMKKFAAGEIDICDASRKINAEEVAACEAGGIEFVELPIAFDGLAVVVHPDNTWCKSLTTEQLKTIWRKESQDAVMKWSDVDDDWPAEPFKLYGPGADSGTFDYFTEVINGAVGNCRQDYSASEDDNALVQGVAGDKGSLGYFGYGYYAENKDKLKLVPIDGGQGPILPDPETVRSGKYQPLTRPLFIYVRTTLLARPESVAFLEYYLDHAADLASAVGYVALTDEISAASRASLATAVHAAKRASN